MFLAAARTLAENSPGSPLLPALHDLRNVTVKIAQAVAQEAYRSGMGQRTAINGIAEAQWSPEYPVF
jgi:malic enzyme